MSKCFALADIIRTTRILFPQINNSFHIENQFYTSDLVVRFK